MIYDMIHSNDKPEVVREKIIVGMCEEIINTTPQLRYVYPKLEHTLRSLSKVEIAISEFGTLQIGTGDKCVFDSISIRKTFPASESNEDSHLEDGVKRNEENNAEIKRV